MSLAQKECNDIAAIFVHLPRRGVTLAKMSGPVLQALTLAVDCVKNRVSSVYHLFSTGTPLDVRRFVVPIVVNPVNGKLVIRSFSDIIDKVLERVAPSVAHTYSSSAIVRVRFILGVITSLLHGHPRLIYRAVLFPVFSMPMFGVRLLGIATTRCASFVPKMLASNDYGGSATAFAFPHGSSVCVGRSTGDGQSAELLPGSINKIVSWHRIP